MTHEQINIHLVTADTESRKGNYDTAQQYISTVIKALDETQFSEEYTVFRLRASLILAQTMWRRSDYNQVLVYADEAISIADKLSDTNREKETTLTKIYNVIGLAYWNLSNYSLSLEYYSKAMELGEKTGDKIGVAVVLGNIGIVYSNLTDYNRALDYFRNALIAHKELGMKTEAANVTCNIGVIYRTLGDYTRALEYFKASLAAFKELGNKAEIARVTGNIGNVFSLSSNYHEGLEYYKIALSSHEELGNIADTAIILGYIGHLYAEKSFEGYNPDKAKKFLSDAIAIDEKLGTKADLYENHRIIAKLYKEEKNWEKFAEHFEKYHDLERLVHNDEAKKQAQRFAIERDIAVMQREKEIQLIKNNELAELNATLEQKNRQLIELDAEKNEFLGIASHDLKNPLSSILMIANFLEEDTSELSIEQIRDFATDIRISSQRMLDLVIDLLDINRIEQGTVLSNISVFSTDECIELVAEIHKTSATMKKITLITTTVRANIQVDPSAFVQVLDNLVSNAIKFSHQDTTVEIHSTITPENFVRISIKDQGPGLTEDDMSKLFVRFQRLSAKPTGNELSTGLGLSITKKLVENMNGRIWCESEAGKGAVFFLEFEQFIES